MDAENKLPENFETLDQFWAFWDENSSANFEDDMEDVAVEIDISSKKIYFAIAKDILPSLRAKAQEQGVSTETLINLWLKEKVTS